MMTRLRRWLGHPVTGACCRLLLGGLFIYAAVPKLRQPYEFARLIYGYHILHRDMVSLAAVLLPWVELVPAVLLILGLAVRSAGLVLTGVLVLFAGAAGLVMARGLQISCGCFFPLLSDQIGWQTMVRDTLLILLALQTVVSPSGWRRAPAARLSSHD